MQSLAMFDLGANVGQSEKKAWLPCNVHGLLSFTRLFWEWHSLSPPSTALLTFLSPPRATWRTSSRAMCALGQSGALCESSSLPPSAPLSWPIDSFLYHSDLVQGAEKFFMIDVREPHEVEKTGLIPTSQNVPRASLPLLLLYRRLTTIS